MVAWHCLPWLTLALFHLYCSNICLAPVQAQYLFTYEINQEDDSRTPKSTLFDPNSFKIVTPSQLQSSYAKISSQLSSLASSHPIGQEQQVPLSPDTNRSPPLTITAPISHHQQRTQPSHQQTSQHPTSGGSFLKQTSAALQSFAELFNFSPAPPATQPQIPLPSGSHTQLLPRQQHPLNDQQVESRGLNEHWAAQQRQRALSPEVASTFASVNSVEEGGPGPALSSFTTATSHPVTSSRDGGQHRTQAGSYWLTGDGQANTQDGSFLFEIKPPGTSTFMESQNNEDQQTSTVTFPHNLLSITNSQQPASLPKSSPFPLGQSQQQTNMAQASFLSTPTTYYPGPASEPVAPTGVPPMMRHQQPHRPHTPTMNQQQHYSRKPKLAEGSSQFQMNISQLQPMRSLRATRPQPIVETPEDSMNQQQQLSPPVNLPEHFVGSGNSAMRLNPSPLRSAEEALNAFRALQNGPSASFADTNQRDRHHQEQMMLNRQHQKPAKQLLSPATTATTVIFPVDNGIEQVSSTPNHSEPTVKISPQIYESFLLQQRDQHEKHMELLKQQQELNRLIEQQEKQKQAETEKEAARKRRKKEELEKEIARKRARQEYELAQQKKLKQELEERRRREEDEKRRRRELEEAAERKRRDEEERRQRELEDRKRRELEEERKRRAEAEELERKQLEERRYREYLEARERELTRREEEEREQVKRLEAAKRRAKEEEEEERSKFMRQKEELRRLLELKAREEQDLEMRRKQVVARASQVERANKLAQELRDRVALSAWVAPMRLRSTSTTTMAPATPITSTSPQPPSTTAVVSTSMEPATERSSSTSTSTSSSPSPSERPPNGRRLLTRVAKKQRVSPGNEKLIRQKIPLYSGPGQYGLYRGTNSTLDSDLAALLDSVTLPAPKSTTTTTTTTPSPNSRFTVTTAESLSAARSSSLSPLLRTEDPNSIAFDDDVPRRPVRNLSRNGAGQLVQPAASNRQQASTFPASASFNQSSVGQQQRHAHIGLASLPSDTDNDGIPGRAGVEYPVLSEVPNTSFSCAKQPLNGYYADTETACQVVHLCQGGVQSSILCPNGTIFNQEKFSCQWWYEVNCSRAPIFYQLNDNLYKGPRLDSKGTPESPSSLTKKRRQI